MKNDRLLRYTVLGILLFLGVCWSLATASRADAEQEYPNADLLASARWLKDHLNDDGLVVVDVRADKYYHGECIPGAVRLPWKTFRYNNTARHLGSVFVGVEEAQNILGEHGILPADTVVLYDSAERDGGATSSYVFWILDLIGHEKKKVLNGGIDAWKAEGGETSDQPAQPEAVLYQADRQDIQPRRWADGSFLYERLGDPYYRIIDVRSRAEYIGEKGNTDLEGEPLKLGHIPGAINIEYTRAWVDEESKRIKPYAELREVYRGLHPDRATIVYCHSGRRSSFSYFILRLMGFADVIEYEGSWNEWGYEENYFPTELKENRPAGDALPDSAGAAPARSVRQTESAKPRSRKKAQGGYVSCGG